MTSPWKPDSEQYLRVLQAALMEREEEKVTVGTQTHIHTPVQVDKDLYHRNVFF